ncbi:hypothetical protein [Treponema pedis]|uniref:hypothetical protein n=3 Tax=Treponema pedis TaxID=409322 RepID=UPI00040E21AF|nr:hypothetical protein [Treponema pedis]
MKKASRNIFFIVQTVLGLFCACRPSIGTAWYRNAANFSEQVLYLTEINVAGARVIPRLVETPKDTADEIRKFSEASVYTVSVPMSVKEISADEIEVRAVDSLERMNYIPVKVTVNGSGARLIDGEAVAVTIKVRDAEEKYAVSEKIILITGGVIEEDENILTPSDIYMFGVKQEPGEDIKVHSKTTQITSEDLIVVFKKFDSLPVKISPDPAVFGGQDSIKITVTAEKGTQKYRDILTVKKDDRAVYNPVDKNKNKKYTVKIKTHKETISPFNYYNENYEFPASKFDEWVVRIKDMDGIVASYRFENGSGDEWRGSDAGYGLKKIWNLKYFRYKTRKDRWHGSFIPKYNPYDERFYFYRFTADSLGGSVDNSMFCVDRYSKFLFSYSEPSSIKWIGNDGIPGAWKDYEENSVGEHIYFDKPFYMSDPVGYVRADGSVVIYEWYKERIRATKYSAVTNGTVLAERSPSKPGYSPYRENIEVTKYSVEMAENPDYTVSEPVIVGQPSGIYGRVGEAVSFSVKTLPEIEGERISFQWFKKDKGGNKFEKIAGAESSTYTPDTSVSINAYCYCEVKSLNTENNKTAVIKSDIVRLYIVEGSAPISIDAKIPKIIKQPEGKTVPIGAAGEITLEVKAVLTDNGILSYNWYEADNEIDEGTSVGANSPIYSYRLGADTEGVKYYYCKITNTNENVDGEKTASVQSLRAKVEVERAYKIEFSVDGEVGGKIVALYNGSPIQSGAYIKHGEKIVFNAAPNKGYKVQNWAGAVPSEYSYAGTFAELIVSKPEFVAVKFEKITNKTLTIRAKSALNISLDEDADIDKGRTYTYFEAEFKTKVLKAENTLGKTLWAFGKDPSYIKFYKGKKQDCAEPDNSIAVPFGNNETPESFEIFTRFVKHDWGGVFNTYHKEEISADSERDTVKFKYITDSDNGYWVIDSTADSGLGSDKVEIVLPANFKLKFGQERDFTVIYKINDLSDWTKGEAEFTYTISWK